MKNYKCRAACPWSKTGSLFADDWSKLCNKIHGHAEVMHRSVNGASWSGDMFIPPAGMMAALGYSDKASLAVNGIS